MAKTKKDLKVVISSGVKDTLPLAYLNNLQGDLKELPEENYKKLKSSILKHGFLYPLFVWEDPSDAKIYLIDGTQRFKTLLRMKDEGYSIPQLPVIFIEAADRLDAKAKLASAASQYGLFTEGGIKEFFSDLNFSDVMGEITIPKFEFANILKTDSDLEYDPETGEIIKVKEHERKINDYSDEEVEEKINADYRERCPHCDGVL